MVEIYRNLVEVYETRVLYWKQLWIGSRLWIKARRVLTSSGPDSEAHPPRMETQIICMADCLLKMLSSQRKGRHILLKARDSEACCWEVCTALSTTIPNRDVCVRVGWFSKNFTEDYEARSMVLSFSLSHSLTRKTNQRQQCLQQATQLHKTKRELNTRYLNTKTPITWEYPSSPLETKLKQRYQ